MRRLCLGKVNKDIVFAEDVMETPNQMSFEQTVWVEVCGRDYVLRTGVSRCSLSPPSHVSNDPIPMWI
jgi:hypothetical protein